MTLQSFNLEHEAKQEKENITFRIDKNNLQQLRKESVQREISLNTLANQVLKNHVDWFCNAPKVGYIMIRKQLLGSLMKKHSEDEIISIAKSTPSETSMDLVLMLKHEYDISSVLDVMERWLRISNFPYIRQIDELTQKYVIQHAMGQKWSAYMSQLYRNAFEALNLKKFSFDATENTIVVTFDSNLQKY